MAEILIQGILCKYRDLRESHVDDDGVLHDGEEILYADLPQDEQYFRRVISPFSDDELVEIASVEYGERKVKCNKLQLAWVEQEEKRMTYGEGVYCMINGELTYIPASYWGYVNHWVLEHGEKPDYREADRIFFLFMEYLYFETQVLGVTRGKGRRQGATSLGFYWMWWICGRLPEKRGGSISFNDDAARKNFQGMFMRGFKAMLPCFVRDFDSKAENFVRFIKPQEKAAKGVVQKREGLNSYCDFLSATLNSYDSGRLSFGLFDEGGKQEKMNINSYWSKVSPTLKTGRKKVGFAYMPTTVNPKNKGGENYEQFWKEANQNAINPNTKEPYGLNTPHKIVRYFVPAYEGYAGCIDKFGRSIIDDPKEPVMGNDGEWITEGAKTVIVNERKLKEGEQLMEHRRDFPLDEYDMFSFSTGNCEFNEERLIKQMEWIELNPKECFLRKVRLFEDTTVTKSIINDGKNRPDKIKREIKFMDDERGGWLLLEAPKEANKFDDYGSCISPANVSAYCIGVDTFRIGFAEEGSKGTICVFKKSCVINGVETGNYPVAMYLGRPRLIQHLYDEVLKACMWYGCKVNFEISAGDFFYGYFHEKKAIEFLYWTPAVDPNKRNFVSKPGTESASPFELAAQLECAKVYIDGTIPDGYNGNVHRVKFPDLLKQLLDYNHSERTPYDIVIALMMALLPALKVPNVKTQQMKPKQLIPTYKIKLSA